MSKAMTHAEVAAHLGITQETLRRYRKREGFPTAPSRSALNAWVRSERTKPKGRGRPLAVFQ